ncbi:hypothetical protein JCM10908_002933 [Rhodotorula pacifica]|uniref:uncharacterized protein n=1 Tax=Rhodotorula pacifica TaxID=1495444 RepID=UPI00316C1C4D
MQSAASISADAASSYALVPTAPSTAIAQSGGAYAAETARALAAPLAQSIARSRISSAPTLLPAHLAQLVTALSLAARVSLRASALFIEAIVETLQRGTATGLGVTRRALIAAVGSARALHYVKQGLDWSGRGEDGTKIEDAFLQVLDKYTNLGIYLIHHTFTLAELFTMSGFYLTLNTIQTGFHAAEESVRMFDSILGSNESSRALSSIITLVRTELTREDPRFRPTGLIAEQDREVEDKQRKKGTISSLTALTKALTAFACLQMATHRRTVRELKQRVVYDCTVVIDRQENANDADREQMRDPSAAAAPPPAESTPLLRSPLVEPTPEFAGRYAGPPNPPRHRNTATLSPLSPLDPPPRADDDTPRPFGAHRRSSSSTSTTSLTYSTTLTNPLPRSATATSFNGRAFEDHILTDVRGEVETRTATARMRSVDSSMPSSPSRSRRTSVAFDLAGLGLGFTADRPPAGRTSLAEEFIPDEIFDPRPEGEITEDLARLCGSPTSARSRAASMQGYDAGDEHPTHARPDSQLDEDECMSCDEEVDGAEETSEPLPPEVQAVLNELEAQYAAADRSVASTSSSGADTYRAEPLFSTGTHLIKTAGGDYSFEIEVEETVTTMTTTVRTIEQVGVDKVVRRETKPRLNDPSGLLQQLEADSQWDTEPSAVSMDLDPETHVDNTAEDDDDDAEWIEIASRRPSKSPPRHAEPAKAGQVARDHAASEHDGGAGRLLASTSPHGQADCSDLTETGRPKLQVVLSSMTSKLSHRKRTIHRVSSALPSSSTSLSTEARSTRSPQQAGQKRRWTRTLSAESPVRSESDPTTPTLTGSPSPSSRSKARSVFRASRYPFKSDKHGTPSSSGASTPAATSSYTPAQASSPSLAQLAPEEVPLHPSPASSSEVRDPVAPNPSRSATRLSLRPDVQKITVSPPAADVPHSPPPNRARHSTSMHTLRSTLTTTCREASLPTGVPEPKSGNFPHQHLVSNLQHFARYSSAAYGQSFLRIFGIAKHEFKFPHTEIHANNHAFAHHVGIHVEDILLSSFTDPGPTFATDKISQIVNYVAVDHSVKAVVLACRGSLGLADILTDLTCSYEPIPLPDGDPHGTYYVHSGMYCSSTTLQRGTVHDVIADALAKYPDYGLVLCGHSLGGGVASLLSILWSTPSAAFREHISPSGASTRDATDFPPISTPFVTSFASGLPPGRPISCYTYGVPCVASPDLVAYCRGLVISTVHNYDIVPTLSLGVLRDFKSMAMGFYAEQGVCEEIVGRVIGLYRGKTPTLRTDSTGRDSGAYSFGSSPNDEPSPYKLDAATEPTDESRHVALTSDELLAGRGTNKALEPAYQDPDLLGSDLIASDVGLSNWLWSLRTTIRASSDNEKLYPPGTVYVVENYGVFVAGGEAKGSGKLPRREGRRVLLRAIDDVERRFSEPVFSRTMLSDHSPAAYEVNCDLLAAAVM